MGKIYLMKIVIVFVCCVSNIVLYGQDTLSSFDKNLVLSIGSFFKQQKNTVLAENNLGATFSDILKNGSKQLLKTTAKRTITDMLQGNNGTSIIQLPNNLQAHKQLFIQKGKANLINNFEAGLQAAAQQALQDGMQVFIGNVFEKLVDQVMQVALSPAGANTDSAMLTQTLAIKNDYKTNFLPFATKAIRTYKLAKQAKKISKFLRKNNVSNNKLSVEDMLTDGLWEKVQSNTLLNIQKAKENPLDLINGLIGR